MTHVIVVNGLPRAGKDTFIGMVTESLQSKGLPVIAFSSIDPVRDMLTKAGFDLSGKTEADRRLLSLVGEAVEEHSRWRTMRCIDLIELFSVQFGGLGVLFLHIREPKNIEIVRSMCDFLFNRVKFITVYLDSIRAETITSNASDAGVLEMQYDRKIFNNGSLADLRKGAALFADEIAK